MGYEIIYSPIGIALRIYDDNNSNIYYNIPNEVINIITELSKKNCELKERINKSIRYIDKRKVNIKGDNIYCFDNKLLEMLKGDNHGNK